MKQKLLFALMLLCMSISSSTLWAERERPTLPEATLVSGNTYYLYNVEADLFLEYNGTSTSTMGVKENELPIEITLLDNEAYTMRVTSITYGYIYSSDEYCRTNNRNYGASSSYSYWSITEDGGSFLIQRSSLNKNYYNKDQYLGWQGDNATSVLANRPITDGVHWKLIPADASGDRYVAALKLYKALQMADAFEEKGWEIGYYVDLYAQRATADINEMTQAAKDLSNGLNRSQGYQAPYWNEYPIFWQCSEGKFGDNEAYTWALPNNSYTSGTYFHKNLKKDESSSITATVNVDEQSIITYAPNLTSDMTLKVYVDNELVRSFTSGQIGFITTNRYHRFFEELTPGLHHIKWEVKANYSGSNFSAYLYDIGLMKKSSPITVNLLEPGSLGTEVLYNTDHIKDVRRLKVIGKMNRDDWSKIKMMHYLQDLDLSEAEFTEIPEKQFSCYAYADTSSIFLHKMRLPEGLIKINKQAFEYSFIDHLEIPSTVKSVGFSAFNHSHIQELILPDDLTDLPDEHSYHTNDTYTFANMYFLKELVCPKNLTKIPKCTFYSNFNCENVILPEVLEEIDVYAFYNNSSMNLTFFNKLKKINNHAFAECYSATFSPLPESLESIDEYAFKSCRGITSLKIPGNVTSIGRYAFQSCSNLKDVEIGTKIYNFNDAVFDRCTSLETLRLNCPTVVTYNTSSSYYPVTADHIKDVTLIVPNHIVTSYKLDNYWYNFKSIEGFSTAEIQDWTISRPLVLNRDRLEGTPNIMISASPSILPSLKINGDAKQDINDLTFFCSQSNYENYSGQILSQCNNVTVKGNVRVDLVNTSKNWHFFSLPFDVKVSDIFHTVDNTQKAIRYYDGANRAENGATGSWKNYDADAVIPAGTGFIMQTNQQTASCFPAMNNDSKQNLVSNKEFVKTLEFNDSENASNKGWNLVGNPWQCYYNNHMLNFTAPITVWNVENRTYTAYSITDDDYAIAPNEAFFVQCPNEEYNTIGFPTQGRQLNAVIESQNAVKAKTPVTRTRQIVNLTISNGEMEDQTRVVLNEKASMSYETACDASKFMSMDNSVPQLYTLDEQGNIYAINERPAGDGTVLLGFYAGAAGEYTISVARCDAEQVFLTDYLTGQTKEITNDSYNFTAEVGTNNGRFCLTFVSNEVTAIESVEQLSNAHVEVFGLDGKYLGSDASKLKTGVYVIRHGKKLTKVSVR